MHEVNVSVSMRESPIPDRHDAALLGFHSMLCLPQSHGCAHSRHEQKPIDWADAMARSAYIRDKLDYTASLLQGLRLPWGASFRKLEYTMAWHTGFVLGIG
jgi:hypothetical protein